MYLLRYKTKPHTSGFDLIWQEDEIPDAQQVTDRLARLIELNIGIDHEIWHKVPYKIERDAVRVTIDESRSQALERHCAVFNGTCPRPTICGSSGPCLERESIPG